MQILEKIISFAKKDSNIRLLSLEGSRANPLPLKDKYSDYDISFFCKDSKAFIQDETWLLSFGKLLFVQKPEDMEFYEPDLKQGWFSYLCLYEDGTKIDFTIIDIKDLNFYLGYEKLAIFLLDKDNLTLSKIQNLEYFLPKDLSQRSFTDVLNEFYHLSGYAWREFLRDKELSFIYYIDSMREALFVMLQWELSLKEGKKIYLGKQHKLLKDYLSKKEYQNLLKSYKLGSKELNLKAFKRLEKLFEKSYKKVAKEAKLELVNYKKALKKYKKILSAF